MRGKCLNNYLMKKVQLGDLLNLCTLLQVKEMVAPFKLSNEILCSIMDRLSTSINEGLSKTGHDKAAVKCYQTYISDFPTGEGKQIGKVYLHFYLPFFNSSLFLSSINIRHNRDWTILSYRSWWSQFQNIIDHPGSRKKIQNGSSNVCFSDRKNGRKF